MAEADLEALAARLQAACLARGLWVAAAESCTGGLVAHAITAVAGSSGYFRGSVVAYANEAKEAVLGVDATLIAGQGAVSAQVARAMALDVTRHRFEGERTATRVAAAEAALLALLRQAEAMPARDGTATVS